MSTALGFYDLMNIAEQNAEQTARKSKTQKFATFVAPKQKKADPKQKALSDNVQKFLAKKKEEERQQLAQEKLKKEKLLELRSHDKKATKRVGQMLRMTKSANKSVIAEAKNCLEDSLAEQDGYQPDEDDYGYVSQHAAEYHRKMMEKYRAIPVNKPIPRPTNNGIAVPEVQSLKKLKSRDDPESPEDFNQGKCSADEGKRKPVKKPAPAALNFADLLQLAQEKCKEPVLIKKIKLEEAEETYEFGRPMTAKEKKAYLIEKAIREKINRKDFNGARSVPVEEVSRQPTTSATFKIPSKKPKDVSAAILVSSSNTNHSASKGGPSTPKLSVVTSSPQTKLVSFPSAKTPGISSMSSKSKLINSMPSSPPPKFVAPTRAPQHVKASMDHTSNYTKEARTPRPEPGSTSRSQPDSKNPIPRPHHSTQQKYQPQSNKMRPPSASSNSNARYSHSPPPYNKPQLKHRQVIDSEDEYDSEMDDFIDDTDMSGNNISDIIRNITGYDKRRYVDGSDDECMESSAWEQMKEEAKSSKIGLLEDLEDMRKEKEEEKRKLQRKMQMKKRR